MSYKNKNTYHKKAISMAILAASLYSISSPISKLLLKEIPPTLLAALLYLGAGLGMLVVNCFQTGKDRKEAGITVKELPYIIGMIVLDIAAPVLLMFGLTFTSSEHVALLNNFEIVSTAIIALLVFKEAVGKRMWLAILLITTASILLSFNDYHSFSFSIGSVFVIMACICWGFENNCTRMLSIKDPRQIVVVKGLGSGTGALAISLVGRQFSDNLIYIIASLLLGFVAYGLSIYFYIRAQRELGAARTSSYYATAPFIGVLISWLIFHDKLTVNFVIALLIMLLGTYFALTEMHQHIHRHDALTHDHAHTHSDGHHTHMHEDGFHGEHSHIHTHETVIHEHEHTPDIHHSHTHIKYEK